MTRLMIAIAAVCAALSAGPGSAQTLYPASGAARVNPDVQLRLTFAAPPVPGSSGRIRIYDSASGQLVDTLDLAIPAGPIRPVDPAVRAKDYIAAPYPYARAARATNADTRPGTPSGGAAPTSSDYQLTIIGGFTDGFHFYPVTIDGNTATIHPHHDLLRHGRRYRVEIDPGVLIAPGFHGIAGRGWRFATKAAGPAPGTTRVSVSADGRGDFDTVQGAMDWLPDHSPRRITVAVRAGVYEEIVYFRNKDNVTLIGEDEARTIVRYANNEVFNPHPANIRTNERPGTFPSRRAAFAADNDNGIHLVRLTIQTTAPGQAEGLLITGERNILSHVTVIGAGDALQANGTLYAADTTVIGTGDTILGRGAAFFDRCTIRSTRVMMWIRNTDANHGNVFRNCTFIGTAAEPTTIARAPENGGAAYPFAEAVLARRNPGQHRPERLERRRPGRQCAFLGSRQPQRRRLPRRHQPARALVAAARSGSGCEADRGLWRSGVRAGGMGAGSG